MKISKQLTIMLGLIVLTACTDDNSQNLDADHVVSLENTRSETGATPADHYRQYCALCHGDDREGYRNDHAPSLRTKTLFAAGPVVPFMATAYGRPGTPMGPYLDELGGPMNSGEIRELAMWLSMQAGVEPKPPSAMDISPVKGDAQLGENIYAQYCASCHGSDGEGGTGTALGNVTMLATTPDSFLKKTILDGRQDTEMVAFREILSEDETNAVVAFLRSRAQGWDVEGLSYDTPPKLNEIVLNPNGQAPVFDLTDGRYVAATDLHNAIEGGNRMILIDTRVPYFWAMAHIRGSLPLPYYSGVEEIAEALPNDGTWIVAYCECPRAAADTAVDRLRELGYENTAVLYEGYAGWAALGYPVAVGNVD